VDRLSQASTCWTLLFRAHDAETPTAEVTDARRQLLKQYEPAARRYLGGLLRHVPDPREAVEECFQELALCFACGRFRNADPGRGRFRDYLRKALRNLANDYLRKWHTRRGKPLPEEGPEAPAVADDPLSETEWQFLADCRDSFVRRGLADLEAYERQTGQLLYTVLKLRIDRPKLRSGEMAALLAPRVGKEVSAAWVRRRLYLSRQKLAELVRDSVRGSLSDPTPETVAQELIDLDLFESCRSAFERRDERS
jgi:RNA polymerase sigma-70 factor (ECF subfamily)